MKCPNCKEPNLVISERKGIELLQSSVLNQKHKRLCFCSRIFFSKPF